MQTVNFKPKTYIEVEQKWAAQTSQHKALTNSNQFYRTVNADKSLAASKSSCTDRNYMQSEGFRKAKEELRELTNQRKNRLKRIVHKQQKSRSRSRSTSSYCEAGCLRKSSNKQKQKQISQKTKNNERKINQLKLYSTIQKFYNNLSSMPLDMLITHTDPQSWLKQQHQICQQLQRKLSKVEIELYQKQNIRSCNVNTNAIKGVDGQKQDFKVADQGFKYYRSMLNAVDGVLGNIEQNMGLLGQLHRQQLNRYNSNTTISSSANSQKKQISTPQNTSSPVQTSDFPSSNASPYQVPQYMPNQLKNEQSQYQIETNENWDMVGKNRRLKQISKQTHYQTHAQNSVSQQDSVYHDMLGKLNNNLGKIASMNMGKKTNIGQQVQTSIKTNRKSGQQQKQYESITNLISTCRSQQSPQNNQKIRPSKLTQNLNQTKRNQKINDQNFKTKSRLNNFVKFDLSSSGQQQEEFQQEEQGKNQIVDNTAWMEHCSKVSQEKTKRISSQTGEEQVQSISELFAMSVVNCGNKDMEKVKNLFKKFASTLTPPRIQIRQPPAPTAVGTPNLKPLITQISSLKQEISQKNRSIQQLLQRQQQQQQIIELYKKEQQRIKTSMGYSNERIKNLQSLVTKNEKQLIKYHNIDKDMRQNINKNIQIIGNLMKDKKQLENVANMLKQDNRKLIDELQMVKIQSKEEIMRIRKSQSVANQKMEIYKQKYYQLMHQQQLKKIVVSTTYEGKAGKVKEIWGILAQHRKNLHTLDQDEQQRQLNSKPKQMNEKQRKRRFESEQQQQQQQDDQLQQQQEQSEQMYSSLSIPLKQTITNRNIKQKYTPSPSQYSSTSNSYSYNR